MQKSYGLFAAVYDESVLRTFCSCVSLYTEFHERYIDVTAYSVGRDGSVGLETRYGLDGPGIESR
jgi:hypothetical protein